MARFGLAGITFAGCSGADAGKVSGRVTIVASGDAVLLTSLAVIGSEEVVVPSEAVDVESSSARASSVVNGCAASELGDGSAESCSKVRILFVRSFTASSTF